MKLRFFARDPTPVSGMKSGRDLPPLTYKLQKISKVKQFFEFREIFCIYLSRFSALFSNEVFAPVKKDVNAGINLTHQSQEKIDPPLCLVSNRFRF